MLGWTAALTLCAALASGQALPSNTTSTISNNTSGSASDMDIELIEANFASAQIVPELIQEFSPQGLLNFNYSGMQQETGANLSTTDVAQTPGLTISPSANATTEVSGNDKYTIILCDANIVGTNENTTEQTRHWLVNGVGLVTGSTPWQISYDGSTSITDYTGPGPAAGSGPHRYVLLVYLQPDTFTAPANLSTADTPLGTFFVEEYVQSSGLGSLIAANYFQVEVGTPTMSIPTTSAVNTAALGMPTSSGGMSMSGSGSASGSASGSKSASASATKSGGAGSKAELGWGFMVGAAGVALTLMGAALVA